MWYKQAKKNTMKNAMETSTKVLSPAAEWFQLSDTAPCLSSIVLEVFSYRYSKGELKECLKQICGQAFTFRIVEEFNPSVPKLKVHLAPQEYCLVNGGMMFTSAGALISDMHQKGLCISHVKMIYLEA